MSSAARATEQKEEGTNARGGVYALGVQAPSLDCSKPVWQAPVVEIGLAAVVWDELRRERTDHAATTEAGSSGNARNGEAVGSLSRRGASTALVDVVETNALRIHPISVSILSSRTKEERTS